MDSDNVRVQKLFIQKVENILITLEGELSNEWDGQNMPIRFIECKVVRK